MIEQNRPPAVEAEDSQKHRKIYYILECSGGSWHALSVSSTNKKLYLKHLIE